MSWDDTGDAIQQAVARSSGMPTIWKDQDRGAPSLDYVTIRIGSLQDVGMGIQRQVVSQDLTRPAGEEIKIETRSDLESTLEIECFTENALSFKQAAALSVCMRTVSGMWLPSVKAILQKQAVSVFDYSPPQWIPDIPSSKFRGRAVSTLRCYMRLPTAEEYTGYIARIRGTVYAHGTASGGSTGTAFVFDSNNG